ncbi:MAG: phytanoyl-CoA dioxygenase family protein [Thermoanaerobaculia bacterium]
MSPVGESRRDAFLRDGFVQVAGGCSRDLESIRRRVDELVASPDSPAIFRFGEQGRKIHYKIPQLAARDGQFLALAQDPRIVSVVEDLIGPARVFRDVVIGKPPVAGTVVHYHQDAAYWDVDRPERVLSAWIALDDAPEQAGCLRVLPGSHRETIAHRMTVGGRKLPAPIAAVLRRAISLTGTGDNPRRWRERALARAKRIVLGSATRLIPALNDLNELRIESGAIAAERSLPIPAQAGDVIFFSSRLIHGSGPNVGSHERRAYIVSYMSEQCRVPGHPSSDFLPARAPVPRPL